MMLYIRQNVEYETLPLKDWGTLDNDVEKKKTFWPFFNAITLTQVDIVAIFHSWSGGISLRQPPWKCADCATLIWVQGVCEASQTFPSVEICFARKRALPWQGHRWRCSVRGSPAFAYCTNEPVWARLSNGYKAVGGLLFELFLGEFCGIPRIFERRQGRGAAVSQSRSNLSQSAHLFHHSSSLTGCQSVCSPLRKQQQLQTIYYPLVTLPLKKNGKRNRFCVKKNNDEVPAAAITARLCCILIGLANVFSAGHFHPWPSLKQDNHEREFFPGCWIH